MKKSNTKRNLLAVLSLGLAVGYGMAKVYLYFLFLGNQEFMQSAIFKVLNYTLMFPFVIGVIICDLFSVDSFNCIPHMKYIFPISYAVLFLLIYFVHRKIKNKKNI